MNNNIQIAPGYSRSIILKGGKIYYWENGFNIRIQNGLSDIVQVEQSDVGKYYLALEQSGVLWMWTELNSTPRQVSCESPLIKIAENQDGIFAIAENGKLYSFTDHTVNNSMVEGTWKLLSNEGSFVEITCGYNHVLARQEHGDVWAWGYNGEYQLGQAERSYYYSDIPSKIDVLNNVTSIAAGLQYSVVTMLDGSVCAWGQNLNNIFGESTEYYSTHIPTKVDSIADAVQVSASKTFSGHAMARTRTGHVCSWGKTWRNDYQGIYTPESFRPVLIEIDQVVSASAGLSEYFIREDGSIWTCGYGYYSFIASSGYYLEPKELFPPIEESANNSMIVSQRDRYFLKKDGTIWFWNENQLPTKIDMQAKPKKMVLDGNKNVWILDHDGQIWLKFGNSVTPYYCVPMVKDFWVHNGQPVFLTPKGDLAFYYDLLGNSKIAQNVESVSGFGVDQTVIVKNDGTVRLLSNANGLIQINAIENAKKVAASRNYSGYFCVIKKDGSVWEGNLTSDIEIENYRQLESLADIADIQISDQHALALQQDGTVWSWLWQYHVEIANDFEGVLGRENIYVYTPRMVHIRQVVSIATEYNGSYFAKQDGSLWGCGTYTGLNKTEEELGGSFTRDPILLIGSPVVDRGLELVMTDVEAITIGGGCYFALKTDGYIFAWNSADWNYQYGNDMIQGSPVQLSDFENIRKISAGDRGIYAIREDGVIFTTESYSEPLASTYMDNVKQFHFAEAEDVFYAEGLYFVKADSSIWSLSSGGTNIELPIIGDSLTPLPSLFLNPEDRYETAGAHLQKLLVFTGDPPCGGRGIHVGKSKLLVQVRKYS